MSTGNPESGPRNVTAFCDYWQDDLLRSITAREQRYAVRMQQHESDTRHYYVITYHPRHTRVLVTMTVLCFLNALVGALILSSNHVQGSVHGCQDVSHSVSEVR